MSRTHDPRFRIVPPETAIRRIDDACDALVADVSRDHQPPVSCRAGCTHCCRQPVFITPLEGAAIRVHVVGAGQGKAAAAATDAYLSEIAARPEGRSGLTALLKHLQGRGPEPSPSQRKALFGPACPFLKDDLCSIYPVRPLMCREHVSFDTIDKCERDEPFFGLDKPRFDEVSAYFSRDLSPKLRVLPVWEFARSADAAVGRPVPKKLLEDLLRWKSGR